MNNTEWRNELPADYDWSKFNAFYEPKPARLKPLRKPLVEGNRSIAIIEMLACAAVAGACIGSYITLALIGW